MKRFCLTLDLVDDPTLIAAYEAFHRQVWPEIIESIVSAGITDLTIHRYRNRLFMTMETMDDFSFEQKAAMDAANPKVEEWETLMWQYQQAVPGAQPGEKWMLMDEVFSLSEQHRSL